MHNRAALLLTAVALGLPTQLSAQALSCAIPGSIPRPKADGPSASQPVRQIPTASYTLALTWSPQYCRDKSDDGSFQCDSVSHFGLMLHGLWPDGAGRQWPQYCAPTDIVPEPVIRDMLCTTPSADLIQHEWAKHGTCGWKAPSAYFAKSRGLYQKLRIPDMLALSRRRDLTVGQFRTAFAQANRHIPGLTANAVRVQLTKDGWLDELWLCLDRGFAYVRCGQGQEGGRASSQRLKIWRGALNAR